jgi:hypothetical protein
VAARANWVTTFSKDGIAAIKPSSAPCPRAIQPPTQAAIDAFIRNGDTDPSFASSDFFGYPAEQPIPDHVIASALQTVENVQKRLASNTATRYDRGPLAAIPTFITIARILEETPPDFTNKSFTPGHVRATAYVYSVRDAKLVCAGTLDVGNTPADTSPYRDAVLGLRGNEVLHREIEVRLRQGLAAGLHAVE